MRRERGSAVLFVMVIMVAITTVIVAMASLSTAAWTTETRREQASSASYALEGVIALFEDNYYTNSVSVPFVQSTTINGVTVNLTVTDNSATLAKTLLATATATIGNRTYSISRTIGCRVQAPALWYCLAVNSSIGNANRLTTGSSGANGDVGANGNISLAAGSSIGGDAQATGTITPANLVNGTAWANAPAVPFPNLGGSSRASYWWNANAWIYNGSTNGFNFWTLPGNYPLIYSTGSINISGAFNGSGTIYVQGDLQITGNVSVTPSTATVAFVVEGDITLTGGVTSIAGYYYCDGTFSCNGSNARTLTRGAIACNAFSPGANFTMLYDSTIFDSPNEGTKLKLPGFWP